jgi:hypothetical protein
MVILESISKIPFGNFLRIRPFCLRLPVFEAACASWGDSAEKWNVENLLSGFFNKFDVF